MTSKLAADETYSNYYANWKPNKSEINQHADPANKKLRISRTKHTSKTL